MNHAPSNPWSALPSERDFVLVGDAPFAVEFNRRAKKQERLALGLLPEPFFGRRDAPLVVLLLNPGLSERDPSHHRNQRLVTALRADIASSAPQTHFHLTDATQGPGYKWWHSACRELMSDVGLTSVASNLLSIEFSPYHSKVFAHGHVRFPSQAYSFWLLEEAMRRNAVVACMRGLRHWCGAVPSLGTYGNLLVPKNARASALSPRNLLNYKKVVKALQ